jgi:ACS family tartrate transporter-like MFS transporter
MPLSQALQDKRVLALAMVYFTIVTATYGITFFLPQIVKGLGGSDMRTGLLTAAPYVVGTIGMLVWSLSSDRTRERKWHFIIACLLGAAGLIAAGALGSTYGALVAIAIATIGIYGSKPAFWPMPSEFLTGTAAAGGIALVNCIGNLGGFLGPYAVGWIKDSTGDFSAALYFLAGSAVLSALITLVLIPSRKAALASEMTVAGHA